MPSVASDVQSLAEKATRRKFEFSETSTVGTASSRRLRAAYGADWTPGQSRLTNSGPGFGSATINRKIKRQVRKIKVIGSKYSITRFRVMNYAGAFSRGNLNWM